MVWWLKDILSERDEGCGGDKEHRVGCKRHVAKDTTALAWCGGLEDILRGNLCNHTPRGKILAFRNFTFYFSNLVDFVENN